MNYLEDVEKSTEYHAILSKRKYRSLIYRWAYISLTPSIFLLMYCTLLTCTLWYKSSGDHDMLVPFLGTQKWIRSLNYSIIDEWRPWFVNGQVAGYGFIISWVTNLLTSCSSNLMSLSCRYTRTYSNNMTYATVKASFVIPACVYIHLRSWFNYYKLTHLLVQGGGHTAPEYKPEECFSMVKRWLSGKAL